MKIMRDGKEVPFSEVPISGLIVTLVDLTIDMKNVASGAKMIRARMQNDAGARVDISLQGRVSIMEQKAQEMMAGVKTIAMELEKRITDEGNTSSEIGLQLTQEPPAGSD